MDMSKAALPPRSGYYTRADQAHPLFGLYRQYLTFCAAKMIDAPDFRDWLYQHNYLKLTDNAARDPEYPAFLAWMRETKAGARSCCAGADLPEGLKFPENFRYWQAGGRW
jgi:hypothetical protein